MAETKAQLVAENGMTMPLGADATTIGRADRASGWAPTIDLSSIDTNRKSSRRHAEIRRSGAGYTVRDTGSANKTFLNGQPLAAETDYPLSEGDVIAFGDVRLRVHGIAGASASLRCPKCSEPVAADMAICASCGANLSHATTAFDAGAVKACFRCGRPARDGEYCAECATAAAEADVELLALSGLKRAVRK